MRAMDGTSETGSPAEGEVAVLLAEASAPATLDQTMFFRAGGDPNIFYLHGYWTSRPMRHW